VKVTVFGMDIKEFPEVNKLYATFFPENPPARSFVQAAALPAGAAIEIEVVAYKE
jgi:2-iminobutanoate/2-iminopropanoate deaminase